MNDLKFDIETRDLTIENGDFAIETNTSVQNGGIILNAHCFSLRFPTYGIGLQTVINAPLAEVNYHMNRWLKQVKDDGATKANFTYTNESGEAKINTEISYI